MWNRMIWRADLKQHNWILTHNEGIWLWPLLKKKKKNPNFALKWKKTLKPDILHHFICVFHSTLRYHRQTACFHLVLKLPTHTDTLNTAAFYWAGWFLFFLDMHYFFNYFFFLHLSFSVFFLPFIVKSKWDGGLAYYSEHTLYSQSTSYWGRSSWGCYKPRDGLKRKMYLNTVTCVHYSLMGLNIEMVVD